MDWHLYIRDFDLLLPLIFLLALAVLQLLRRLPDIVRMRKTLRNRLKRAIPALELGAGLGFLLSLTGLLLPQKSPESLIVAAAAVLLLVLAGWFAIKDIISGVILKSEEVYEYGDWIKTRSVEGRIVTIGHRTLEIETEEGDRVKVPYSRLTQDFLAKSDHSDPAKAHTFQLALTRTIPVAEAVDSIRRAVLNAVWSSVKRDPQIEMRGEQNGSYLYEITVYALDSRYFSAIEGDVRYKMSAMRADGAQP